MRCPNCQSPKLVAINIKVATGEDKLTFRSCRNCEHKWWEREATAERLPLATVLELARVRRSA